MLYPTIYRRVIFPLHGLVRRRTTPRWYRLATRQQWLGADELAALQRDKLARLARHCAASVPFYRDRFAKLGIDPQQVHDITDLRDRGLRVGKQDIRDAGDAMIADGLDKRRLVWGATSGSTGAPLTFYKSVDTNSLRVALKYRSEDWIGMPMGTRTTLIWGRQPARNLYLRLRHHFYWAYQNYQFLSAFDIGPERVAEYLHRIERFGSEFIEAYVTAVDQMAIVMRNRSLSPPRKLRGIVIGAEQLVDEQKQHIESAFGCPVYNRYGSTEFKNIACECTAREGLHINADHLIVEVVDDDDRPLLDQLGEIVVTDLSNLEMPMLRYRIGDRGILSSARCRCGRALPMLRSVNGRTSDRLITPAGREIHDMFFLWSLAQSRGVLRFQVVQQAIDQVRVDLQLDGTLPRNAVEPDIRRRLGTLADEGMTIAINTVDRIPLSPSGKMRHFLSELPSSANGPSPSPSTLGEGRGEGQSQAQSISR